MDHLQLGLIVLLGISVIVLGVLLYNCTKKEKFHACGTCQGMSNKVWPNRPLLSHLYQTGELTENSDRERKPAWPTFAWDSFQSYDEQEHSCRKAL